MRSRLPAASSEQPARDQDIRARSAATIEKTTSASNPVVSVLSRIARQAKTENRAEHRLSDRAPPEFEHHGSAVVAPSYYSTTAPRCETSAPRIRLGKPAVECETAEIDAGNTADSTAMRAGVELEPPIEAAPHAAPKSTATHLPVLVGIESIDLRPLDRGVVTVQSVQISQEAMPAVYPFQEAAQDHEVQEPSGTLDVWWDQKITEPLRHRATTKPINLENLVLGALWHSPRVRAISMTPLIQETTIVESQAQFDWRAFMESRFTDTSDPVGSTLTTGGPNRLEDKDWRYSAGLRRKIISGGKFEIAQRIGLEDSNSRFFVPSDQANSKLALNFTQPLLNGSGRAYNQSLIVLAQIDSESAHDEFSKQLQNHLLEVTRAYWELYQNRVVLLQKRKLLGQATKIMEELESRREIDSLKSQVVRARAAVAARRAEIVRCEMAIRNAESSIRVLVNDPELLAHPEDELLPQESPLLHKIDVNLGDSLATAMQHRPEIDQATQNVRAATVRLGISRKELQPVLDFVAEAYASGLTGNSELGNAFGDQFSEGRPSYSVGLIFEIPLGNRQARARFQRRQLELEQVSHELQNVIETTKAEVEIAVRQVETSFREMQSKHRAVLATEQEVEYLQERWSLLPGEDQSASFVLEDLLDAQERLASEEFEFVAAQVAYTLSISELKRATGTLLEAEHIEKARRDDFPGPPRIPHNGPSATP